jgi:predicted CXXCH cytochrome family protein
MGRSFRQIQADDLLPGFDGQSVENQPSGMRYTMQDHDGQFVERRSQVGFHGEETNVVDKKVDYVIGSGNHARTFLHRDAQGRLIELPVSWYAEKSGYWAMSPGYDRRDQEDFRRAIPAECMFCHNGYPEKAGQSDPIGSNPPSFPVKLPEGIDCQRCHGPGRAHVAAVTAGASIDEIEQAIVNPAKLDRDGQLEVCMQCHLETSSSHMPNEIRLAGRGVFSYRPSEPLGEYKLYFDPRSNQADDRFEIAHAAYRLRMSACFRNSQMTCLTCHDPHEPSHGEGTTQRYVKVCASCHEQVKHSIALPETNSCVDCHMPKRRTEDAVHVVMTDHYIQRVKPERDLLAPRSESSNLVPDKRGVTLYYPTQIGNAEQSELYLALADVKEGSSGEPGVARLEQALLRYEPSAAEFYFDLAHGYSVLGNRRQAIRWYEEAIRRRPRYPSAAKELADAVLAEGQAARAEILLREATVRLPGDGQLLADLGNVYLRRGRDEDAQQVLLHALKIDSSLAEAENMLGLIDVRHNRRNEAEARFRAAIRDNPTLAEAHCNLANLLSGVPDYEQAAYHFGRAIALDPDYAAAHHGLGLMLELMRSFEPAISELQKAAQLAPSDIEVRTDLADLLAANGQLQDAEEQYQIALRSNPESADLRASSAAVLAAEGKEAEAISEFEAAVKLKQDLYAAHLQLALLLAKAGRNAEARIHLRAAAQSPDSRLRNDALNLMRQLGGG